MKTKLLKRLRLQTKYNAHIPINWILAILCSECKVHVDELCKRQLRDYILYCV